MYLFVVQQCDIGSVFSRGACVGFVILGIRTKEDVNAAWSVWLLALISAHINMHAFPICITSFPSLKTLTTVKTSLDIRTHTLISTGNIEMSDHPTLPDPRMVITGHTGDGTSIFVADQKAPQFAPFGPQASSFATFHSCTSVPASNQDLPPILSDRIPRNPPSGIVFCTTDLKPGAQSPIHRTLSLDYCAVLSGEVVLILDGGEEKTLRAGDFVVQRGANHAWANRTAEICRIAFVMVGAEKVRTEDGSEIGEADIVK
ncbi:MAG: hypothetical protein Q9228_006480 [Teloschistes exilis]